MNTREGFLQAASLACAPSAEALAAWDPQELARIQDYSYLSPPYQRLAVTAINHVRQKVGEGTTRQAELIKSSIAGIWVMTKFASFLPYVYRGQRSKFPHPPQESNEQLLDLTISRAAAWAFLRP